MGLGLIPSGDGEIRTLDPLLARQVLSQLSYTPMDAGLPSFQRRSLIHLCSVFISISQSLVALPFQVMGLSGLEPPTSRLSGVRSNRLSYKPIESGIHLLSHAVSSIVPSADQVLTVVFGMGTGVSPDRIDTRILVLSVPPAVLSESSYGASLPKPFRTVRQYDLSVTQI